MRRSKSPSLWALSVVIVACVLVVLWFAASMYIPEVHRRKDLKINNIKKILVPPHQAAEPDSVNHSSGEEVASKQRATLASGKKKSGRVRHADRGHRRENEGSSMVAVEQQFHSDFLQVPFFDLFEGATIQEIATMEHKKFLETTFVSVEHMPSTSSSSVSSPSFAPLAYALIISNEDFVDGALVLGASLLLHSNFLKEGKAELVLIVTENRIGADSKRRLSEVGFTVIATVPSLARFVPGAALKDTFDKIFMFALVMFHRVVFMDADMLNVKNADELFDLKLVGGGNNNDGDEDAAEYWVRAIGFRGDARTGRDGDYFQTGMMVFQPGTKTFARVLNRFAKNIPPRGKLYNQGMNGRDGVLIRDVFQSNFSEVSNKYSRNMNPRLHIPEDVVSLHFRGRHKMWYDRRWKNADPEFGKKEFGFNYVAWWNLYEQHIHKNSQDYKLALSQLDSNSKQAEQQHKNNNNHNKNNHHHSNVDASGNPYGGTQAAVGVSSLTHVWMMRHTRREYVQLLHEVEEERLKLKYPANMEIVAGKAGQSCNEVCSGKSLKCLPRALNFTQLNNCSVLEKFFDGCPDGCEMGVYWRPHPGQEFPGLDMRFVASPSSMKKKKKKKHQQKLCVFNYRHDDRCFPTCEAFNETTARLCPCGDVDEIQRKKIEPAPLEPGDIGF